MTLVETCRPRPESTPNLYSFTCATCTVIFENAEVHRIHFRSDWHRYNLRRKVQNLPPVTEAIHMQRSSQLVNFGIEKAEQLERKIYECNACNKSFSSENSYESHVRSRKHLENDANHTSKQINGPSKEEADSKSLPPPPPPPSKSREDLYIDADATEKEIQEALEARLKASKRLNLEDCIFCNHSFESFESNMEHMTKGHGLYIPDLDFVEDLPALMGYLTDKVGVAFCCLYCSKSVQPFQSLESVRRHMIDKGHSKIRFDEEGMEELSEFYNYEEILCDDGDENFVDIEEGGEGEQLDLADDEQDGVLVISPDETELILPSGKRLGNRAYRQYYKQNIRIEGESEQAPRRSRKSEHLALISRISDHYLATGLVDPMVVQRRFISDQRRDNELDKDWSMRIGVRNNGLQEHFRHQLRQ